MSTENQGASSAGKVGYLLLNLGTPDQATPKEVARYLREFLMDPYVIDIPWAARWLLVQLIIAPFRSRKSAHAYQQIWTDRGSPLLFHTADLTGKVRELFLKDTVVEFAMRYGNPSIKQVLTEMKSKGVTQLRWIPLYPQYSLAATESSVVQVNQVASELGFVSTREVPAFFDHPAFLDAYVQISLDEIKKLEKKQGKPFDHFVLSFHGLPERHVQKTDLSPQGNCLKSENCCSQMNAFNKNCYRAQCFSTARNIAERMGWSQDRYSVAFQSRLGRTPWIKPFSDELFSSLPKHGFKRVAVLTPAFVADCLETLEEVAMRGNELFVAAGGEKLSLVPSVNSDQRWAVAVSELLKTI